MNKAYNRRNFLKNSVSFTAGLMGFPYIIRASALGNTGTLAPSNRLTMAQIGCGSMGGSNLNAFLNMQPQVQVVAVCDLDDRHAHEKKRMVDQAYGNSDCKIYHDYRELLEHEPLDCVSHALPDHWHAAVTLACAQRGIDMYGEKPFARSIGEGRAMCETIDRHGLIWQTGSWQRSVKDFHDAAELVRNGRIGKVSYVEVGLPDGGIGPAPALVQVPDHLNWDMWLGSAPWRPYQNFNGNPGSRGRGPHWDWRWIMDYSGGQLTDWAGHHVDIAHWGLDLEHTGPVEIEGTGQYPDKGIYDVPYAYNFLCTYANGVKIRVANRSQLPRGMGTCWYGDQGWIHVSRAGLWASNPAILRETVGPNETQLYRSDDHHVNFVECVRSRQETITPAETAHRSISVALLGEIAMLTGQKLKWDPISETFAGNESASRYLMRSYRSPWRL